MGFMNVTDRTDALRDNMDGYYGDVVGVFTQDDTWDVHVFLICRDEDGLVVAMFDCASVATNCLSQLVTSNVR